MLLFLFNQIREKNKKIKNIRLGLSDQPTINYPILIII